MNEGINIMGDWTFEYENGTVIEEKNIVVLSGLSFLAALFIGEKPSIIPFHLAMGTGTTAAASTDTMLHEEVFRKPVSAKTRQANMLRLRTYLLSSEANGDWKEFGIVLAGTDQIGSGTLFNRLVTPISKASNMALTIECRLTLAAG
ncbi:hypothetical protein DFP93_102114 [Aneurinibacillus soli]|uniref:Uncharacterized protein n=1 Tax=Aneurinibacillus soli TaxID=1500254 RepID=A0A0U5B7P7_9BACL|nr:hypothetical protein [Aneurinibacillus soli]PYE63430.1 hypothetical protein DFP93_102114 [Aneurinibacillus soli]BAU27638.1 hypothetical protein CB4_01812 [Aneurinibacillus soli]